MPEKALAEENFEDLVRRYRHGHFILNPDTEPKVVYLREIGQEPGNTNYLQLTDCEGNTTNEQATKVALKEAYPEKGIYNIGRSLHYRGHAFAFPTVVYFQRRPRRQWAHGVRPETCHLQLVGNGWIQQAHPVPTYDGKELFRLDVVQDMFFPWYPKSKEELFKALEIQPIVALDRNFALMHSWYKIGYVLMRHLQAVGEAEKETFIVKEEYLRQEVEDIARRFKMEVEHAR
jgi:hypothetical protein